MNRVTLYVEPACAACRAVMYVVRHVRADIPFELEVVDVSSPECADWKARYGEILPVVHVNGVEIARGGIDEGRLRQLLAK